MPYIKQDRREKLDKRKLSELGREIAGSGEAVYVVTKILWDYLTAPTVPYSFSDLNDIRGILESAMDEFNRRVIHPYEDKKIEENGDVFTTL